MLLNCGILKKAMATHSSTLAWKIPWTDDLGALQSPLHSLLPFFWVLSSPPAASTPSSTFLAPFHNFLSSPLLQPSPPSAPMPPSPFTSPSARSSPSCGARTGEPHTVASSFCYGFWIQHIWIPGPRCVVATATPVPLVNTGECLCTNY